MNVAAHPFSQDFGGLFQHLAALCVERPQFLEIEGPVSMGFITRLRPPENCSVRNLPRRWASKNDRPGRSPVISAAKDRTTVGRRTLQDSTGASLRFAFR